MSPARRKEMLLVQQFIQQELRAFESLSYINKDHSTIYEILHNKANGLPLRGYFAFKLFHYLKEEKGIFKLKRGYKKFFEQQLPFILEAIISIQYYHNQILDGKAGVTTPDKINHNLVIGNLFKDQLYRYIEQVKINKTDLLALKACVRSIFEYVDIGQYIEKHCNTYEALQSGALHHPFEKKVNEFVDDECITEVIKIVKAQVQLKDEYLPFLKLYLQRIYMTNGALFRLVAELISNFMEMNTSTKAHIVEFAGSFGVMQQITNDNCDLVSSSFGETTIGKDCEDGFSDLKNKNITLPILIHFQRYSNSKIEIYLKNKSKMTIENQREFFKEITQTLSIYYSMKIGKLLKKLVLSILNAENRTFFLFEDICDIVDNNRYFKYFYAEEKYYKLYKKESQEQEKDIISPKL